MSGNYEENERIVKEIPNQVLMRVGYARHYIHIYPETDVPNDLAECVKQYEEQFPGQMLELENVFQVQAFHALLSQEYDAIASQLPREERGIGFGAGTKRDVDGIGFGF